MLLRLKTGGDEEFLLTSTWEPQPLYINTALHGNINLVVWTQGTSELLWDVSLEPLTMRCSVYEEPRPRSWEYSEPSPVTVPGIFHASELLFAPALSHPELRLPRLVASLSLLAMPSHVPDPQASCNVNKRLTVHLASCLFRQLRRKPCCTRSDIHRCFALRASQEACKSYEIISLWVSPNSSWWAVNLNRDE